MMAVEVGVIMGSTSDEATMAHACRILEAFEVPFEKKIVSAHRTPDFMFEYAEEARARGLKVIIAGAGGAAHLPGYGSGQDDASGDRRAHPIEGVKWLGFASFHRSNAERGAGGHRCDRRSRSGKRGVACRATTIGV